MVARHRAWGERKSGRGCQRGRHRIGVFHRASIRLNTACEHRRGLRVDDRAVLVPKLVFTVIAAIAGAEDRVPLQRQGCIGYGEAWVETQVVGVIEGGPHPAVTTAIYDIEGIFVAMHLTEGGEEIVAQAVIEGKRL